MPIQRVEDLFRHELRDAFDAERRSLRFLEKAVDHVHDADLKEALEEHRTATAEHVTRVEEMFGELGWEAEAEPCLGMRGIEEEHDRFMAEEAEPALSDVFHAWAAIKAERYEVTTYEALLDLALRMGADEVVDLIEETLEEEEATVERLLEIAEGLEVAAEAEAEAR